MAVITVYNPFNADFYGAAGWDGAGHPEWWEQQAAMPPGKGVIVSDLKTAAAFTVKSNIAFNALAWIAYRIEGDGFNTPFYGDPIFMPPLMDFGTVTNDRTFSFTVYNASILPKLLNVPVVSPETGVTLVASETMPFVLGALETVTFEILVSMNGPSTIAGAFEFFIGGDTFLYAYVGVRSLAFSFPVTGTGPVRERISYKTVVDLCLDGTESRYGLMPEPRLQLEAEYTCFEWEALKLRESISSWMAQTFDVYQWQEETRLMARAVAGANTIQVLTQDMPWEVGQTVVIFQDPDNYEVMTIQEILADSLVFTGNLTGTWVAGCTVMPRVTMRLMQDMTLFEQNPYLYTMNAVWRSDPTSRGVWCPVAAPALTYKGIEVFPFEHNWRDGRNTYIRQASGFMDQGFGGISLGYNSSHSPLAFDFVLYCDSRLSLRRVREFLHRRKGKLNPVYLPSGRNDLILTEGLGVGSNFIYVTYRPEIQMVFHQGNHRNIVINRTNGTKLYATIVAVEVTEEGEVQLELEEAFDETVPLAQVISASYLYLARQESDETLITRYTPEVAEVALPLHVLREAGLNA